MKLWLLIVTPSLTATMHSPREVLQPAEKEKKAKYILASEERGAFFTPVCCSVDGVLGMEGEMFVKGIAENLAIKWDQSYGVIMEWIRAQLFAILR